MSCEVAGWLLAEDVCFGDSSFVGSKVIYYLLIITWYSEGIKKIYLYTYMLETFIRLWKKFL
jgi:hypothetical protein